MVLPEKLRESVTLSSLVPGASLFLPEESRESKEEIGSIFVFCQLIDQLVGKLCNEAALIARGLRTVLRQPSTFRKVFLQMNS